VADFHEQSEYKNNASSDCGYGEGDEAVGDAKVGMQTAQPCRDHGAEDCQQQADGEAEQRSDKSHEQHADGDAIPAWGVSGGVKGHEVR